MRVVTMQHTWVKHTITKVEVLDDGEGNPVIVVDPMQQELAEEDAAYGCQVCDQPLATHYNTDCLGEDE